MSILFLLTHAPEESNHCEMALDAALTAALLDQEVGVASFANPDSLSINEECSKKIAMLFSIQPIKLYWLDDSQQNRDSKPHFNYQRLPCAELNQLCTHYRSLVSY